MAYLFLLIWALALIGASYLCRRIWSKLLGKGFRVLATPGILVHELSHAAGCLIMGARVTDLSLYDPKGGYVAHTEPKVPIIGRPLIALAPILGCGFALWLILQGFGTGQLARLSLPSDIALTSSGLQRFIRDFFSVLEGIIAAMRGANYSSAWTYIFIYLALSMGLALGPSKQDLRNAVFGLVVTAALVYLFHLLLNFISSGSEIDKAVLNAFWHPLSFAVGMMTLLLAVSGASWSLHRAVISLSGRSKRGGSGKGGSKSRRDSSED